MLVWVVWGGLNKTETIPWRGPRSWHKRRPKTLNPKPFLESALHYLEPVGLTVQPSGSRLPRPCQPRLPGGAGQVRLAKQETPTWTGLALGEILHDFIMLYGAQKQLEAGASFILSSSVDLLPKH